MTTSDCISSSDGLLMLQNNNSGISGIYSGFVDSELHENHAVGKGCRTQGKLSQVACTLSSPIWQSAVDPRYRLIGLYAEFGLEFISGNRFRDTPVGSGIPRGSWAWNFSYDSWLWLSKHVWKASKSLELWIFFPNRTGYQWYSSQTRVPL